MAVGLRFRTWSITLGTAFDWFVPDGDMPDAENSRGVMLYRDIHTTPSGNTYLYDKGKRKEWKLTFRDISTTSKERLEHVAHGWFQNRQITMVYFGSSVIGTNESPGSMASVGQCWGTGYVELNNLPAESASDLWNVDLTINQFGPDQSF